MPAKHAERARGSRTAASDWMNKMYTIGRLATSPFSDNGNGLSTGNLPVPVRRLVNAYRNADTVAKDFIRSILALLVCDVIITVIGWAPVKVATMLVIVAIVAFMIRNVAFADDDDYPHHRGRIISSHRH